MLECERRVQELISKQGRSSQFSTAKERDAWIGKEEKSMGQFILAKKQQIKVWINSLYQYVLSLY
jgi:hypothetical protein